MISIKEVKKLYKEAYNKKYNLQKELEKISCDIENAANIAKDYTKYSTDDFRFHLIITNKLKELGFSVKITENANPYEIVISW